MTNLDIIKYLATNNPTRLAEFLNDVCYDPWDCGATRQKRHIINWEQWLQADPYATCDFSSDELEEWSKAIDSPPTITAFYDGLSVTLPVDDPDHLWNKDIYNSKYEVIDQAIDEIKLLENVIETTKHPDIDYVRFRKSVCAYCPDLNCMRSQVEICDCHKFKGYH